MTMNGVTILNLSTIDFTLPKVPNGFFPQKNQFYYP